MTYRKFKADYLFTGEGLAAPGSVLITAADGEVQAVVPSSAAGEDIAYYPGLLSPGFVNCHCHLELSHLKGRIPKGTGLVDFLSTVVRLRERSDEPAVVQQAIARAEDEMLDGGIIAVGDICNTSDTLEQKKKGRLYYHNFIETIGFIDKGAPDRWAHSLSIYDQFGGLGSIVPHAPYSVSPTLFRLIAGFPGNRLLTIHNQESEDENIFLSSGMGDFQRLYRQLGLDISFFRGTGKRGLASWLPYFYRNQEVIAVHNVATFEEDLSGLPEDGPALHFCLCPGANLYIGNRLPDVDLLMRRGCRLVIGTDSLASNHRLSILEEMKTLQERSPKLATPLLLQWATSNGARALGIGDLFGNFAPGTRPGVLLLEHLEGDSLKGAKVRRLL
ncbi:MAG TPA: amidohydrolase family protein [Puia sp.]|jgi:cytosine/adenosine deaminase-related metal-dependent hydrolase|nr:amidohydrolase family protein [Puia sp.]